LAQHDYETDSRAEKLIESLCESLDALRTEHREMRAQLADLKDALATNS
jgi:uncharacterized membrane protein